MSKPKKIYVCQNCGAQSPKWLGQCRVCNEWNSFSEEITERKIQENSLIPKNKPAKAVPVNDIQFEKTQRIDTGNNEFNRVLGGGLVKGAVVLIGGEPGIGKSTLALQVALDLDNYKVLYVSAEESLQHVKIRAERIGRLHSQCLILSETSLENIFLQIKQHDPDIIVIDSIQTIYTSSSDSVPGSLTQVRECTQHLIKYAKNYAKPVIIIGHINKSGSLAGPKVLEHLVDTVLQFEGDRHHLYRILRANKNRFGAVGEPGIFEMDHKGLRQIPNPSEFLLSHNDNNTAGISAAASIEGIRPLMTEVQALVSNSSFSTPQRNATGFDNRRLNMLLAVIEKRMGYKMSDKDVFLNTTGGIRIEDPAADLAVIASLISSGLDIAIPREVCFAGEIGLSGEIRPVSRIAQRISEARKLGFKNIFISKYNKNYPPKMEGMKIIALTRIETLVKQLFKGNI